MPDNARAVHLPARSFSMAALGYFAMAVAVLGLGILAASLA
jgi:hypothetical protein